MVMHCSQKGCKLAFATLLPSDYKVLNVEKVLQSASNMDKSPTSETFERVSWECPSILARVYGITASSFDGDLHDMRPLLKSEMIKRFSQECPFNFRQFVHNCKKRLGKLVIFVLQDFMPQVTTCFPLMEKCSNDMEFKAMATGTDSLQQLQENHCHSMALFCMTGPLANLIRTLVFVEMRHYSLFLWPFVWCDAVSCIGWYS